MLLSERTTIKFNDHHVSEETETGQTHESIELREAPGSATSDMSMAEIRSRDSHLDV